MLHEASTSRAHHGRWVRHPISSGHRHRRRWRERGWRGSTEVLIVFLLAREEDGPGVVELAVGAHQMVAAPFRMPASVQERLGAHNTREHGLDLLEVL